VPDIAPRRRILLASAAALPLLLATAGCRSSDAFTGPDPLAGRPRPAPDVVTLAAVIAAEENLIGLYRTALARDSAATVPARDLLALLAQHEQHLTRLRARLIQPPGTATAAASSRPSAKASAAAPERVTIARLRAAERASAAGLVQRLATVEPALAQLFASIAASDATHVTALGG
jgi:phosphomannomutase